MSGVDRRIDRPSRVDRTGFLALVAAVGATGAMVGMQVLNERLKGASAPHGIVSFQLAGSQESAAAILGQWHASDVIDAAKTMMLLDLGYPIVYAAALALGVRWAALRVGRPRWVRRGLIVAVSAAVADYIENAGQIWQLWTDTASAPAAGLALVAAIVKFALLVLDVLAIVVLVARPGHSARVGTQEARG